MAFLRHNIEPSQTFHCDHHRLVIITQLFKCLYIESHTYGGLLLVSVTTNIIQTCREIIAFLNSWINMILQHEQPVDSRANIKLINQIWGTCNEKAAKDVDTRLHFPGAPAVITLATDTAWRSKFLIEFLFADSLRDSQNDKTSVRSCAGIKEKIFLFYLVSISITL